MDCEEQIMELIVNSGNARGIALSAVTAAVDGDFEKADALLAESGEQLIKAHNAQTELIQAELNGEQSMVSLLMVHAQDHLMNALTVKDMAAQIISLTKKLTGGEKV